MTSTTELYAGAELHNANLVAILLAKEGNGTQFLCFLDRRIAEFLEWNVGTNLLVDDMFHLAQLLWSDLLKV